MEHDGPVETVVQSSWRAYVGTFVVVVLVFLLSPNVLPRGDSALSIPTAHSLLHEGNVDLSEYQSVSWVAGHYALTHYNGRTVDFFPWLVSASAVPFVAVVDLVSLTGLTPSTNELIRQDRSWLIHYVAAAFWSALAAVLLAAVVLRFLGRWGVEWNEPRGWFGRFVRRRPLLAMGLAVALSTQLWSVTSRALVAHAPAMVCVAGAMLLSLTARRGRVATLMAAGGGGLCAVAFWTRPITLVATVVVALLIAFDSPRRLVGFVTGLTAAHLAIIAANQALFGGRPPYFVGSRISLHSAYGEALAANLVSPARGLLVFCPQFILLFALLVPRIRRRFTRQALRTIALLVGGSLVVLLVVSAYGFQWWAGHTYGSRYMTDALPFLVPVVVAVSLTLCTVSSSRFWRGAVVFVWAVAVVVQFQGAWFHSTACWDGGSRADIDTSPGRVWNLSDPQLTSGFRALVEHGPANALWAACLSSDQHVSP